MAETTTYEKYLNNEPLTEEIAALMSGQPDPPPPFFAAASQEPDDRPLTKVERQALREARQAGGVAALVKIMRKSLHTKLQEATMDSERDPLGRAAEIAQGWAYVLAFRRALVEVENLIRLEIEELEKEERGQKS